MHVGFEPLEYGIPGMVIEVVTRVVAEYVPELVVRLTGPTGCSGEDCIAPSPSTGKALTAMSSATTLAI